MRGFSNLARPQVFQHEPKQYTLIVWSQLFRLIHDFSGGDDWLVQSVASWCCCSVKWLKPSDSTVTTIYHYRLKLSESQMFYPLSDTAHCFQVTCGLLCFGKSYLEVTPCGWQDVKIQSLTNFIAKNNNAYNPRERENNLHGPAEEQASHHHQAILSLSLTHNA